MQETISISVPTINFHRKKKYDGEKEKYYSYLDVAHQMFLMSMWMLCKALIILPKATLKRVASEQRKFLHHLFYISTSSWRPHK